MGFILRKNISVKFDKNRKTNYTAVENLGEKGKTMKFEVEVEVIDHETDKTIETTKEVIEILE